MMIAYTMSSGKGTTDRLLADLTVRLSEMGIRTCGTVQINTDRPDRGRCDMDLRILPNGPEIRISQSLGREATGCRLDPAALETAVQMTADQLDSGADILIVNKFGNHEAEGRGFREVIATALSIGVPVLVGLSMLNEDAFNAYTTGQAVQLAPDMNDLLDWTESQFNSQRISG